MTLEVLGGFAKLPLYKQKIALPGVQTNKHNLGKFRCEIYKIATTNLRIHIRSANHKQKITELVLRLLITPLKYSNVHNVEVPPS